MKKLAIATSLVAAMAAISGAQAASTGTINFNGLLTATTCNVSVNEQGAEGATVTLPTIGTNVLAQTGDTAARTSFNMLLSECSGTLENAAAYFEAGSSVDLTTGRLKNMTGDANNVELQLRDGSSDTQEVIQVGSDTQIDGMKYVDITSGTATLPYLVEYYATDATTAGTVVSSVVYHIQYK